MSRYGALVFAKSDVHVPQAVEREARQTVVGIVAGRIEREDHATRVRLPISIRVGEVEHFPSRGDIDSLSEGDRDAHGVDEAVGKGLRTVGLAVVIVVVKDEDAVAGMPRVAGGRKCVLLSMAQTRPR